MLKAIETIYNGYRFRSRLEARWAVFFDTLGIKYEYEMEGYDLDGEWYLPDFWLPELDCWIEIKGKEPTLDEFGKAETLCMESGHDVHVFWGDIPFPYPDESQSSSFVDGNSAHPDGYCWCECDCGHGLLCVTWPGWTINGHEYHEDTPRLIEAYTAARQARFEHREKPRPIRALPSSPITPSPVTVKSPEPTECVCCERPLSPSYPVKHCDTCDDPMCEKCWSNSTECSECFAYRMRNDERDEALF